MFFLGQLNSTITMAQVTSDLVGLITGSITATTSLTAFSQSTCKIISTTAPGWSLYDAAAGTAANGVTPVVIRSAWSDSPTNYKNIQISALSSTNLLMNGYETWNSTNHTGTWSHLSNSTPGVGGWPTQSYFGSGWVMISASPNHLMVVSFSTNTMQGANYAFFASEYTRDDSWNTVANGYPAWFTSGQYGSNVISTNGGTNSGSPTGMAIGRLLNTSSLVDVAPAVGVTGAVYSPVFRIMPQHIAVPSAANTVSGLGLESVAPFFGGNSNSGADANKATAYILSPLRIQNYVGSYGPQAFGSITAMAPFVYAFRNVWQSGDEVAIGGTTYFNVILSSQSAFLIKEQ